MMNTNNSNSNPNRRAQCSYHCYACQNEWRQLVNPSDLTGVQCPSCASDFYEETKSYQEEVVAIAQPEPAQQHQQNQQVSQQPDQNVQLPVRQETMQMGPNGGWTRSVTISYGNGSSEQPTISSVNMGQGFQRPRTGSGSQNPPQAADPFMDEFFNVNGFMNGEQRGPQDVLQSMMIRGFMQHPRQQPQSQGCSTDFIKNLPQKEEGKESDCYICLEKCSDGESSCQLPCNHAFDRACIENWLKDNDTCPVCRVKLDQTNASNRRAEEQQNQRDQASAPQLNNNFFFF